MSAHGYVHFRLIENDLHGPALWVVQVHLLTPRVDYGTVTTDKKELAALTVTELGTNRKSQVVVCLPRPKQAGQGGVALGILSSRLSERASLLMWAHNTNVIMNGVSPGNWCPHWSTKAEKGSIPIQ